MAAVYLADDLKHDRKVARILDRPRRLGRVAHSRTTLSVLPDSPSGSSR